MSSADANICRGREVSALALPRQPAPPVFATRLDQTRVDPHLATCHWVAILVCAISRLPWSPRHQAGTAASTAGSRSHRGCSR